MKFKVKKYNIVPLLLLVYLAVMLYLGYPDYVAGATSPWLYFGGGAFTLAVIILLRFNLKKRAEYRKRRGEDIKSNDTPHHNNTETEDNEKTK